jgi:hypothetical protein
MKLLLWALVLLLIAGNCRILLHNPTNNDVSWYLYVAQDLLAGKHLYTDIIETNPPLICYLFVIPVWIAQVTGLAAKLVWVVLATTMIAAFSAASAWLWARSFAANRGEQALTLLSLLVLSLAYFFAFDFGQRDHLAFVASIAVTGLIACRIVSLPVDWRVTVGLSLIAGLLLALKPFFLLPWFLCLVFEVRKLGWRAAARFQETWIVPAMSSVQLLLVVFVTPAFLPVARVVSSLYSGYDTPSWFSLLTGRFLLIALIGSAGTLLYRALPRFQIQILLASLLAVGWALSGLLQRKGWHYHALPGVAALGFTVCLLVMDLAARNFWRSDRARLILPGIAALLLGFAFVRSARLGWNDGPGVSSLVPLVNQEPPGRAVITLSTGMFEFPLVNETGSRFAAHYSCLWPLPALYADQVRSGEKTWHYHSVDAMGTIEKELFDRVSSDLVARPKLIIIQDGNQAQGMGNLSVRLEDYFGQDPNVRTALTEYERVPFSGDFVVLRRRQTD